MDQEANQKFIIICVLIGLVILTTLISITLNKSENIVLEKKSDVLLIEPKYTITSSQVRYYENRLGHLSQPEKKGFFPGVIMIHEWWGLNENIKKMADNLASQGYIVLAVDLYGEVTTDPLKARELSSKVRADQQGAINNMQSAIEYLKNKEKVEKIASLGWCFGGGQSLQISLNNEIDATVIYYGNLITNKSSLSNLNGPILGIFGNNDSAIPVSIVKEFNSSLENLNIEKEIYIYPDVGHAFANPSGDNYSPVETKDAWNKTLYFLEKNLN